MSKSKKNRVTKRTLIDRLPSNHGEWLELCVKFTDKAIHDPPYKEDQWLIDQSERLEKQLEEWRKNNET